jgi:bifunctional NMN adenylyltransferase/nudix hydrolase
MNCYDCRNNIEDCICIEQTLENYSYMIENKNTKIGVIVGRFQTPFLTDGHIDLIETVLKENDKVIIVLGVSNLDQSNIKYPFSYKYRKELIEYQFQKYSDKIRITHLDDIPGKNMVWNMSLDYKICVTCDSHNIISDESEYENITLYGCRDSFLNVYTGNFKTKEIKQKVFISATEIRDKYLKIIQ